MSALNMFVTYMHMKCRLMSNLLTVRCWNSQAFMILVAILGKIPRFFCLRFSFSSSSSLNIESSESGIFSDEAPLLISINICKRKILIDIVIEYYSFVVFLSISATRIMFIRKLKVAMIFLLPYILATSIPHYFNFQS